MNLKTAVRTYPGADSYMCGYARVVYDLLMADLSLFNAFDHTIDATYCAVFLTAIEQAETFGSDRLNLGVQQQKVSDVNLLLRRAVKQYADVMYFVNKAFPSGAMKHTFGFGDLAAARNNRIKMIDLLDIMDTACIKNKTALNEAGFSDAAMQESALIRAQLQEALSLKSMAKKHRTMQTEARINILNHCYGFIVAINSAAQLVFAGDVVKQRQFVYLPVKVRQSGMRVKKIIAPAAPE